MMNDLINREKLDLDSASNDHPVKAYLSRLHKSSHPSTLQGLNNIAQILAPPSTRAIDIKWHLLRYEHSSAIRQWLVEQSGYTASTINRHLSVLRRILKECWVLGLMDAETYYEVTSIPNVKGKKH